MRKVLLSFQEDLKYKDEAARLYEYGLSGDLPKDDFQKAVKGLSILQRQRGDMAEAIKWWERAAREGQIYAQIELAKYYEHRIKNYALAEDFVRRAIELVNESQNPHAQNYWGEALAYRLERLMRKKEKKKRTS